MLIDSTIAVGTRILGGGERMSSGAEGEYRRLCYTAGEARVRRLDLVGDARPATHRTALLHFVHLTDLHVSDVNSPGRLEYMERFHGDHRFGVVCPSYRPQEALHRHAVNAMIGTLAGIKTSELTGAPLQFAVCTGDLTDNRQQNELQGFLALATGGEVAINGEGEWYEGVQGRDWQDPAYWHPDGFPDGYKARWGFPLYPGILEQAVEPFVAAGFAVPWYTCLGNHDALVLGGAQSTPEYEQLLLGQRKLRGLPPSFDIAGRLDSFRTHPEIFLRGSTKPVSPNPARRGFDRREFIKAHLGTGESPVGHGFDSHNVVSNTAYYVADLDPNIRLIMLDTTNPRGHHDGSIGSRQFSWLEERLIEAHSAYYLADDLMSTGNVDRLVIIGSHHGLDTLTNGRQSGGSPPRDENDPERVLGPQIEHLLHRFPNVALWINGHIHRNRIQPRFDPARRTPGFWEITTSSLLDWPCQARLIELIVNGDDTVSIVASMIDHDAPPDPREATGRQRLASIHRELAANDPAAGIASRRQGQAADRNAELLWLLPPSLRVVSAGVTRYL